MEYFVSNFAVCLMHVLSKLKDYNVQAYILKCLSHMSFRIKMFVFIVYPKNLNKAVFDFGSFVQQQNHFCQPGYFF